MVQEQPFIDLRQSAKFILAYEMGPGLQFCNSAPAPFLVPSGSSATSISSQFPAGLQYHFSLLFVPLSSF